MQHRRRRHVHLPGVHHRSRRRPVRAVRPGSAGGSATSSQRPQARTATITYSAILRDLPAVDRGDVVTNSVHAALEHHERTNPTSTAARLRPVRPTRSTANVTVIEPVLSIDKNVSTGDSGPGQRLLVHDRRLQPRRPEHQRCLQHHGRRHDPDRCRGQRRLDQQRRRARRCRRQRRRHDHLDLRRPDRRSAPLRRSRTKRRSPPAPP